MNTQKQILLIVVTFFAMVAGCAAYTVIEIPYRSGLQEDYQQEESIERGALLFANNCRTCHGIKGEGGVGFPLNKEEFKNQDPLVRKANQELIRQTIFCGRAGTLMPAWVKTLGVFPNERSVGGPLNLRQIDHLVDLITAPAEEGLLDEDGNPTNKGWQEAVEFAHNLNHEASALIGGDSLSSVAQRHQVGPRELAALNNVSDPAAPLRKGTKVKLPANVTYPKGRTIEVKTSNQTIAKIADSEDVGTIILAELNKIPYRVDKASGDFILLNEQGQKVPGLFPGTRIALPEGASYIVSAGDTLEEIAAIHGVSAQAVQQLNSQLLSGLAADAEIPADRRLKLPAGAVAIAAEGATVGSIAIRHGLTTEALAAANNIPADATIITGQRLKLPDNTGVIITTGDTLDGVANGHGISVEALAKENNLDPGARIGPEVILQLPGVNAYTIQGQSLGQVSEGFSNVTAESLGQANQVPPDAVLRVGQVLRLPEDTWGGAPPTTPNPGTACVLHAVPGNIYNDITGASEPPERPAVVSTNVEVQANANDWTVVAGGETQPANRGAVFVAKGATITFVNKVGIHTITIDDKKNNGDFQLGQTRPVTFPDSGEFRIECDYHPAMLAFVFVE
ncbi:MAG: LysM peptidoglycan-binding domain-containing protein [Tepidiformaceae bacterium]